LAVHDYIVRGRPGWTVIYSTDLTKTALRAAGYKVIGEAAMVTVAFADEDVTPAVEAPRVAATSASVTRVKRGA